MNIAQKGMATLGIIGMLATPSFALSAKSVKVDVPFEFTAGNTQLPAGEYSLQQTGENYLQVRDADREVRATVITRPRADDDGYTATPASVIFHQYGDQSFLSAVDADGLVDVGELERALCDETKLVSVMAANNEIGVLQPIAELAGLCTARGIPFHTDAAQAAGRHTNPRTTMLYVRQHELNLDALKAACVVAARFNEGEVSQASDTATAAFPWSQELALKSEVGAGDRVRTGDPRLGKPMLCQLSYARSWRGIYRASTRKASGNA